MKQPSLNPLMPVIFLGHGNPMNALSRNSYTNAWAVIGKMAQRPKAVLAISAHWYIPATAVTAAAAPRTIHDFGGFPPELYQVQYPAPGSPELAGQVRDMLAPTLVGLDEGWGLDHGAWSVLCHVFPKADIPIVQLSIDKTKPPQFHYELGRQLAPLRERGVLILSSGNLVHNLRAYVWGREKVEPFDWALRFENHVRGLLTAGEDGPLIAYEDMGRDAMMSVPTPDHYLPLLYVLGARAKGEPAQFPVEGFDGGAISMLAVQFG